MRVGAVCHNLLVLLYPRELTRPALQKVNNYFKYTKETMFRLQQIYGCVIMYNYDNYVFFSSLYYRGEVIAKLYYCICIMCYTFFLIKRIKHNIDTHSKNKMVGSTGETILDKINFRHNQSKQSFFHQSNTMQFFVPHNDSFINHFMTHWLVTGKTAPLPLTQCTCWPAIRRFNYGCLPGTLSREHACRGMTALVTWT